MCYQHQCFDWCRWASAHRWKLWFCNDVFLFTTKRAPNHFLLLKVLDLPSCSCLFSSPEEDGFFPIKSSWTWLKVLAAQETFDFLNILQGSWLFEKQRECLRIYSISSKTPNSLMSLTLSMESKNSQYASVHVFWVHLACSFYIWYHFCFKRPSIHGCIHDRSLFRRDQVLYYQN